MDPLIAKTQIVELLERTFTTTKEKERKDAEDHLEKISQENMHFLEILAEILLTPKVREEIKCSASNYFIRYIKTSEAFKKNHLEGLNVMAQLLFNLLKSDQTSMKVKKNLSMCLNNVFIMDTDNTVKQSIFVLIIQSLGPNCQRDDYIGAFMTIQSVLKSSNNVLIISNFFQQLINNLKELGLKIMQLIESNLANFSQETAGETTKNLTLFDTWTNTIKEFAQKFAELKKDSLNNMIFDQQLPIIFAKVLCIQLKNEAQIKDCLFSTSNNQTIDSKINGFKYKVVKAYNVILKYIFEEKAGQNLAACVFYKELENYIPIFIQSLLRFCNELIDIEKAAEMKETHNLMVECLNFLAWCTSQNEYYQIFCNIKEDFIILVLLPLIRTTKQEQGLFLTDPNDFVSLALDTCDKQESGTYKTASAHLLELLCDHIDGCLSFVGAICANVINYSIRSNHPEEIPIKFQALIRYHQCRFIVNTSPEIRVETSLIVFSILSYVIPKRPDILDMLQHILIANIESFLSPKATNILKSRLCLLIGYYSENLFKNPEYSQFYTLYMRFLVECLSLREESEKAVSLMSIDSLTNIFEDQDLAERLNPLIPELFAAFNTLLPFIQNTEFFDMIGEVVKTYSDKIATTEGIIVSCVQALVQRVLSEYKKLEEKNENNNIFINKCWNVIRTIAEHRAYIPRHLSDIERELLPLFNFLETPEKVEFEEDILQVITSFIKHTQKLTPTIVKCFLCFTKIFEKYNCIFGPLFLTLNYFIVYGDQILTADPTYLEILKIMGTEAMFAKQKKANESNHAEGALMLQILIQNYSMYLSPVQWEGIYTKCLERLEKEVKFAFLRARIYGVFISGFLFAFKITQEILLRMNKLHVVLEHILTDVEIYKVPYEKKIFILGMSSILVEDNVAPYLGEKFPQIMDQVITMLKLQQMHDEKLRKSKSANQIEDEDDDEDDEDNQNFNLDDDDEDEDWEDDEDDEDGGTSYPDKINEELEAKFSINSMISKVKEIDEFENFRTVIFRMKERNQPLLLAILNTIPETKKGFLREVLQSQRVQIDKKGPPVARRVVKVKKK